MLKFKLIQALIIIVVVKIVDFNTLLNNDKILFMSNLN